MRSCEVIATYIMYTLQPTGNHNIEICPHAFQTDNILQAIWEMFKIKVEKTILRKNERQTLLLQK